MIEPMYSQRLIELFHQRAHGGVLDGATHFGQAGQPGGGPYIQIWLRVQNGTVEAARWRTYGCPAAIACAEAVCGWSTGRPVAELKSIATQLVTDCVDGVPEGKEHCPELAVAAVIAAANSR